MDMSLSDEFTREDQSNFSEEEFHSRLQMLVCLWIEREIPLWRPDLNRKYLQTSQSLLAPMPEGDKAPAGLVYFKSVFDPLWTSDDISLLQQSAYPWIFLILSPGERFYEFDPSLEAMTAQSSRIMVWRPSIPAREEMRRLREWTQDRSVFAEDGVLRQSPDSTKVEEIWKLLADVYVKRGLLMCKGTRLNLKQEAEAGGLRHCLALHLGAVAGLPESAAAAETGSARHVATTDGADEGEARHWAEALTGVLEFRTMEIAGAMGQFLAWWDKSPLSKASILMAQFGPLPETLMTTRFWRALNGVRGSCLFLQRLTEHMRTGDDPFATSMSQLAQHFGRQEDRLRAWKNSVAEFAALASWLPMLIHAQDYLRSALPLGLPEIEELRQSLLDVLDEPHRLLESSHRQSFDRNFLAFKKSYVQSYCAAHEERQNLRAKSGADSPAPDKATLRDLEILASLEHMDRSYLNRVGFIIRWIQQNRCDLPVREILERAPRCYCNFNPICSRPMVEAAARIQVLVTEGIECYRNVLRQCRTLILEELAGMEANAGDRDAIASLLSQDAMVHLRPEAAKILTPIIRKHAREFAAARRSAAQKKGRPIA